MRLITLDDITDVYSKARQRGLAFLFSKLNLNSLSRTKSAFNETAGQHSSWWIIPRVKERWNLLITGNPETNYRHYLMNEFLKNSFDLRLISLGSGYCGHEMELAAYSNFKEIICLDIAQNRLSEAEQTARERNLNNMKFVCTDFNNYDFKEKHFDIVLFNSSLHHFKNVRNLLQDKVSPGLKDSGLLIINEFVGPTRLQFSRHQIKAINKALKLIPPGYRKRFKTSLKKNRFYGSGLLKMILADPSECIDSASILPSLHSIFTPVIERPYGGNILMNALKDISHHFTELDADKEKVLEDLFSFEDQYLTAYPSDYLFGIYKKP